MRLILRVIRRNPYVTLAAMSGILFLVGMPQIGQCMIHTGRLLALWASFTFGYPFGFAIEFAGSFTSSRTLSIVLGLVLGILPYRLGDRLWQRRLLRERAGERPIA